MLKDAIIAIREPFYGTSVNDELAICVHHPTDLVRISKFDPRCTSLVSDNDEHDDLLAAGVAAEQDLRYFDAVHLFSEGLKILSVGAPKDQSISLLFHRGFAFMLLKMYEEAVKDAKEVLKHDPSHKRALNLLCSASLNLEDYDAAQTAAASLSSVTATATEGIRQPSIIAATNTRVSQSTGICNLAALAKTSAPGNMAHQISDHLGDVDIRNNVSRGRGLHASKKVLRGTILLWEKPIAICSDEPSSFQSGLEGLFGPSQMSYCNPPSMSFMQQISQATTANPSRLSRLFDMYDGELASTNAPLQTEAQPAFDR